MASDDLVPYGEELSDEELVDQFFRQLQDAEEWFEPIHGDAARNFKVYGVDGKDEKDKAFLDELKRVSVDLPFCKGIVDTIMGADMAQATEPQWRGEDEGSPDNVLADLLTRVVRHVRTKSSGHRKESGAYFDMLIGGYGYTEAYMDMTRVPVRPVERHIEPWEVYPDPDAVEDNLTDARFFIQVADWPLEQVQARWPDKKREIENGVKDRVVTRLASPMPTQQRPVRSKENKWSRGSIPGTSPSGRRDKVTVYCYQYQRDEPRVVYYDPETGERVDAPHVEFLARKREIEAQASEIMDAYAASLSTGATDPPPEIPELGDVHNYPGKTWYRCYLLGNQQSRKGMLLERQALAIDTPTIVCVTGFKKKDPERGRVRFFGIMPVIIGLEFWLTRGFETYLEIMARGAKGGATYEKIAIPPGWSEDKFKMQFSVPGGAKMLADGTLAAGAFQYDPVQAEPSGFWRLVEVCRELMGFLTGITPALQGTLEAAPRTSNVFVSNLQEQGLQMLLPIREPKTAMVVGMGKLLASLVVHHLPAAEIDKILGKIEVEGVTHMKQPDPMTGEEMLVPIPSGEMDPVTGQPLPLTAGMLLKDPRILEYDVVTDVGAATPSQRQDAWRWISQHGLGQLFKDIELPPHIWIPPTLENSPLPGTMSKKMADEAKAFYDQQQQMQTAQGFVQAFQGMMEGNPEQADKVHQQIMQMMQMVQGQPAPPAGEAN